MSSIFDENSEFLKYLHQKSDESKPLKPPVERVEMHIGENGEFLKKTKSTSSDAYVLNLKQHEKGFRFFNVMQRFVPSSTTTQQRCLRGNGDG